MKYFDAHTHANFAAYADDRDAVMMRAAEAEVGMNNIGTQLDTSKAAIEMANKYGNTYATIGLHPIHTTKSHHDAQELGEGNKEFTSRGEMFDAAAYEELGRNPKVIAIGECGLDYFRIDESTKGAQEKAFIGQIDVANKLGKPLMLHVRPSAGTMDAYHDALEILAAHAKVTGDSHFFAGNWEVARKFLDMGFMLSFTGVLTFTHDYDEVVQNAPLDMILSETDAPYVSPVPHRGTRNEPAYVIEVVRAIARIKGMELDHVAAQLMANTSRLFGI